MSDFIFRKSSNGVLEFVGDFEGYYASEQDPWQQSGQSSNDAMDNFYRLSRERMCAWLSKHADGIIETSEPMRVCEVGSGYGYLTNLLCRSVPSADIYGTDISSRAVKEASMLFPFNHFIQHDILERPLPIAADVIILSNILWYVIHRSDDLFENLSKSFKAGDHGATLVVQNALFSGDQLYARDSVSSFGSLIDFFDRGLSSRFVVSDIETEFVRGVNMQHDFALLALTLR